MANMLNVSNLTLNPKEVENVSEFIKELTYKSDKLASLYNIFEDVKMKTQIVLVDQLGLTGIAAGSDCGYVTSGAEVVLGEKYWEPAKIEDKFEICQAQISQLFKGYYSKIKSYREMYDITGSDEQALLISLVENATADAINRLIWFGDTEVAAATEDAPGLKNVADAKFYNPVDGFFKQIASAVADGTAKYVDITALQSKQITPQQAFETVQQVYMAADSRVRSAEDAIFYVSGDVYIGLMGYAVNNSLNFQLDKLENGIQVMKVLGIQVANMENVWRFNELSFEATSEGGVDRKTRVILTTKSNMGIATLEGPDSVTVESWYSQDTRKNNIFYGFTIDSKILRDELITVAY